LARRSLLVLDRELQLHPARAVVGDRLGARRSHEPFAAVGVERVLVDGGLIAPVGHAVAACPDDWPAVWPADCLARWAEIQAIPQSSWLRNTSAPLTAST